MTGFLEERRTSCTAHGDYTAYLMRLGDVTRWTSCPECAQEQIAQQATQERCQREAQERTQVARGLATKAGLPARLAKASLAHYEVIHGDRQAQALGHAKAFAGGFAERADGGNLLLLGSPGTGKTHLACAILRHVIGRHLCSGRYLTAQDLFFRVRASYTDRRETEAEIIDELVGVDLLVIDEVGIGRGTDHEADLLAAVLSRRYDAVRSTVLVSNLGLPAVRDLLGERIADRLAETADILIFDWPSYRRG